MISVVFHRIFTHLWWTVFTKSEYPYRVHVIVSFGTHIVHQHSHNSEFEAKILHRSHSRAKPWGSFLPDVSVSRRKQTDVNKWFWGIPGKYRYFKGLYLRNGSVDHQNSFTIVYCKTISFNLANKKFCGTPPLIVIS